MATSDKNITQKQSGFTITELAVSLMIIGSIIGLSIFVGMIRLETQKHQLTFDRLEYVQQALINYAHTYERLPCPANPASLPTAADAGLGTGTENAGTCNATNVTCAAGNCHGVVPYKELGISEQAALDGWNNKITYGVSSGLTFSGTPWDELTISDDRTTAGYRNDGNPEIYDHGLPTGSPDAATQGVINVIDSNANTLADDAAFALISHGKNGWGGFTSAGVQLGNSTSSDEQENYDNFSSGDGEYRYMYFGEDFDDFVYYKTKWQIEAMK